MPHPTFLDDFLEARAVRPDVAEERGYWFIELQAYEGQRDTSWEDDLDLRKFSKRHRRPSIVIPTYGVDGERNGVQLRPRHPGDPKQKYVNPPGEPAKRLNVHPWTVPQLSDTSIPLWAAEGIPKADSLVSHGMAAIGLISVTTWECDDWKKIPLQDRNVFIVFDSDYAFNPKVKRQQEKFAAFLQKRNAHVWITYLPPTDSDDPQKQGVDDWLATWPIDQRYSTDRIKDLIDLSERFVAADDDDLEDKIEARVKELRINDEAWQRRQAELLPPDDRLTRLIDAEDILNWPDPQWLIHGLIPDTGVGQIFGQSQQGKSFIALDLALSVTNGFVTWHDLQVSRRGDVVYVVMEGAWDLKHRIRAWLDAHPGTTADGFRALIEEHVDLGSQASMDRIRQDVKEAGSDPRLIVVDTQGKATPNRDENSSVEMNAIEAMCRSLASDLNCFVLLVHHTGWDDKRVRGSSAQLQAVDVQLHVDRGVIKTTKARYATDDWVSHFRLTPQGKSVWAEYCSAFGLADQLTSEDRAKLQAKERILAYVNLRPKVSANAVCTTLGGRKSDVLAYIEELIMDGKLIDANRDTNSRSMALEIPEPVPGTSSNGSETA